MEFECRSESRGRFDDGKSLVSIDERVIGIGWTIDGSLG